MPSVDPTSYPIDMPPGNIANIIISQQSAQQVAESPRNFTRHVLDFGGERWRFQITIQRGTYQDTAPWRAFFGKMRGSRGTCYINPYGAGGAAQLGEWNKANDEIMGGLPAIRVKTGQVIDDHRITLTTALRLDNVFKAGDYIQLGQGSNSRIHMVTDDISITGQDTTINLWPAPNANLSSASMSERVVTVSNPRGVFYFRDPIASWTQDRFWHHEVRFEVYSAVT